MQRRREESNEEEEEEEKMIKQVRGEMKKTKLTMRRGDVKERKEEVKEE